MTDNNKEEINQNNQENVEFEHALTELEKVVQALERGELTLEESLKKFQKGIELSRVCNEKLKQAEKQIEKLTKDEETGELKFEPVDFEEE
ncbi:exodeoxyribonuclease VII small subunit [Natranaerobius thermophilus]|uniref:Exodeoxyribonuclease 7 small subunit n=1 Tax=Natranaerobius thermophilus (strain ATCC BAA-1301 / DSM 18059 / JW/NM-WN-LF) TaxID=457570 RepID=B2A530_NATTJ|nr:exodeoxyribonuclease VII small subunit [Natranaerobius thermophilus]ACB85272.1 Exodeoxyribonuclease VII small subunit [Natranaerobius thermophilus JW/NM-WN-LF]